MPHSTSPPGKVIGQLHARHRAIEFQKFLTAIDKEVPADLAVRLVMDNVSTRKTPAIQRWLLAPSPLRRALHSDLELLAQPGRTLVQRAHHQEAPTWRTHQRPRPQ